MITFSICVSLIILALIAAIFAQQSSDWVLPRDREMYFPPFFKSEGFYRSFLINLSFAGVSTAAAAIQFVRYKSFWMICDPSLAIFLSLGLGLFVSLSLRSESSAIENRSRWVWSLGLLAVGAVAFAFAVWTTVSLSKATPNAPTNVTETTIAPLGIEEHDGQEESQDG